MGPPGKGRQPDTKCHQMRNAGGNPTVSLFVLTPYPYTPSVEISQFSFCTSASRSGGSARSSAMCSADVVPESGVMQVAHRSC